MRVLVAGDVMLDRTWFGDVDRISPEAPVPVVRLRREENRLGGAANVARNAAQLGAQVTLLGIVGDDPCAALLRDAMSEEGIADRLTVDPAVATTLKLRVTGRGQQLLRVDREETPGQQGLTAMLARFEQAVAGADVIVLSDYGKGALARVGEMIALAGDRCVLVDPKGRDFARYRGATALTPNRAEFAEVAGGWTDEAGLERLGERMRADLDLDTLIVTRSDEGMSLFDRDGALLVPAEAREVFDITGAGDTVIATLAVLSGSGMSLRDALPLANKAGGIVVGRLGTAAVGAEELFAS